MSLKSILEGIFEELNKRSLKCMIYGDCYGEIETALDNQLINYKVEDGYGGEDQGYDY